MDYEQAHRAMITKLAESGLNEQDAKKLELKAYGTEDAKELALPLTAACFELPYFELSGKRNCFSRYRLLESPAASNGFAAASAKPPKYLQHKNSEPNVYLSPVIDWDDVFADPKIPIQVTEGELKAACACKLGYPTIGLGGVWSFMSKKLGVDFLPILEKCIWKDRRTMVVYDSDAAVNPDVVMAENKLARQLLKRGGVPYIVRLPQADGKKQGLDDYLMANSLEQYDELASGAPPWGHSRELHEMNEEVVYCRHPGFVVRLRTMQELSPDAFKSHQYANRTFLRETTTKGLNGKPKTRVEECSVPQEWIKWPARSEIEKLIYEPGEVRFHQECLNTWSGWGCEPKQGNVKPWKELLNHLFTGFPLERRYFEQWCAYPLQYPGTKMFIAAVVWGIATGTGKSLIGNTLKPIYGENFAEISRDELINRAFNGWAKNKQFVLGDEVTAGEKRGVSEYLKTLVTRETIKINIKNVPEYFLRDCINWYFTSNKPDAFFMEDADRRLFIHEVKNGPLPRQFYLDFIRWRDHEGGAAALFHYLLNVSLEGFDPHAPALDTAAKHDMRRLSKSALGDWIAELIETPVNVLRMDDVPLDWTLATTRDLLKVYDPQQRTGTTVNAMARELQAAGVKKINNGKRIHLSNKEMVEMWIVGHKPSAKNPKPTWIAKQYEIEHNIVKKNH